jgi:hypothetical protein
MNPTGYVEGQNLAIEYRRRLKALGVESVQSEAPVVIEGHGSRASSGACSCKG